MVPMSMRHTGHARGQVRQHSQVFVKRGLHAGVIDGDIGKLGAERGMAAVVGPISVDNLNLGNGGVAALFLEIALEERDISQVHRQTALGKERLQARFVEVNEPVNNFDGIGFTTCICRAPRGARDVRGLQSG